MDITGIIKALETAETHVEHEAKIASLEAELIGKRNGPGDAEIVWSKKNRATALTRFAGDIRNCIAVGRSHLEYLD